MDVSSTSVLLSSSAKEGAEGPGGRYNRRERTRPSQRYWKSGSKRVFPSMAGLEPGRQGKQGEQDGSRCGKLPLSQIERRAGGWLWGAGALRPALRSKESEL